MNEWLVIGPPGTGKTTYLSRLARRGVEKWGSAGMVICSLTKAAAREAAGRETGLDEDCVGTLHSLCHRALGRPALVENRHLDDWNSYAPQYSLSKGNSDDEFQGKNDGDKLLLRLDLLRAKMIPKEMWPIDVNLFYKRWIDWKIQSKLIDFTDLIENSIHTMSSLPNEVKAIGVDEVQDSSKLEISLIRRWSTEMEQTIFIGDPDQSLFHWRGADQGILRRDGMSQVLKLHHDIGDDGELLVGSDGEKIGSVRCQSYRVPRLIHSVAVKLIETIESRTRIRYHPTPEEGIVIRSGSTYLRFESLLKTIEDEIGLGNSVMILCSCEFMLRPIIKLLRETGIPYGNKYALRWNPLSSSGVRMSERIISFLRPSEKYFGKDRKFWSSGDIKKFATVLRSEGILVRGAKKRLEEIEDGLFESESAEILKNLFDKDALIQLSKIDLEWYLENLVASEKEAAKYPARILRARGIFALSADPMVCVGTIHSVKGGESDTVIVFPDLSPQGYTQYKSIGWGGYDSIVRMFYVAITRARKKLIIGSPSGQLYANF